MVTLAAAIEVVEQLSTEQQDMLVQIIRNRQIERRREEIAQNGREAMAAYWSSFWSVIISDKVRSQRK